MTGLKVNSTGTILFSQIAFLVFILATLEYLVGKGVINKLFIAAPSAILRELLNLLCDGTFYDNLLITLYEFAAGFIVSAVLGIGLGILIARVSVIEEIVNPFLSTFMAIPKVAVIPIIIVWIGIGPFCKMLFVFLNSFFNIIYNTIAGVKQTSENYLKVTRVLGASKKQIVTKVILPSAIPTILAGIRAALPAGFMGAIFSEMLGSKAGLGNALVKAAAFFNTSKVFALVAIITTLLVLLINGLNTLEKKVFLKWKFVK